MKNLLFVIIVSNFMVSEASILYEAHKYLPSDQPKKTLHITSSPIQKSMHGKQALEYWNSLKYGSENFIDLITKKTREKGFKQLGLLAKDIQEIEELITKYCMTYPSEQGDIFMKVFELARAAAPDFIAKDYENQTLEFIKEVANDDKYDKYLGPKAIRLSVAEYVFQAWHKARYGHKKYWHVRKGENIQTHIRQEDKDEIEAALAYAKYGFQYIETIKNNRVAQGIEYIIVPAANSNNQNVIDTLNAILDPRRGNSHLKIIIAFNDNDQAISDEFKVLPIIKNLIIVGKNITTIGNLFLSGCSGLQSIDLTPLSQVTQIGYSFLYGCSGLQSIDLTSLSQVIYIGNSFLYGCARLQSIDLTPLSQVTKIGGSFLEGCSGLQSIDLTSLSQVTQIGGSFLSGCLGLQSIDLTPLSQVTWIGGSFLSGCSGLQSIDLTPLSQVTQIGDSFLYSCLGLQSIDLAPLSQVTQIGSYFFENCFGLQRINLTSLSQVTWIGVSFLAGCSGLQGIDLTSLSQVTQIGGSFLSGCSGLQSIDLTPLSQVTQIGGSFLSGCSGLQRIDLTPLSQVTQIGDSFLYRCSELQSIDLTPLSRITKIGSRFMARCYACKKIFLNQKLHNVLNFHNSDFLQKNKDKLTIQEEVLAGAAAAKAA